MRLPIEAWVAATALPEESTVAFAEAATAFKAGAYRAALLFSYLGWGLTLRARLLAASGPPSGMPSGQWHAITKSLRDDDKWDSQVFDCTQMQPPSALFIVSDDLRMQVRYWKDRRNDCAHFKLNEISSAHVEALWAFIRSNLGRFVPMGSEAGLIDAFLRHFDPNITPPETDIAPLVRRLGDSIRADRIGPFLNDLAESLTTSIGKFKIRRSAELATVLTASLRGAGRLGAESLALLLRDLPLLADVLRRWPEGVGYLAEHPEQVRLLWRTILFVKGHSDLNLYAALLRNALIPVDQIPEANHYVAGNLQGHVPSEVDVDTLSRAGFFEAVKAYAFEKNMIDHFGWGNRNAPLVAWYLQRFPLDDVVVSSISDAFHAPPYPFTAEAAIKAIFAADPAKLHELQEIAQKLGKPVPSGFVAKDAAG